MYFNFEKFLFLVRTMLEALINFFPMKETKENAVAGVGSLEYSSLERKKLAIVSRHWSCEICGTLNKILIPLKFEENEEEISKEKDESLDSSKSDQDSIIKEEVKEREPENFQIDEIFHVEDRNHLEDKINAIHEIRKNLLKNEKKTENEEIKEVIQKEKIDNELFNFEKSKIMNYELLFFFEFLISYFFFFII